MAGVYDVGDRIRLGNHSASGAAAFKNAAGTDADPDLVKLTMKLPDNTLVVYVWPFPGDVGELQLTKEGTGRFYVDYDLTAGTADAGTYRYRLAGTGVVMAAEEGSFTVTASTVIAAAP
jgi:hypothetical protein